ncbi:MAG: FAD/NAD(P)-binding protein [Chthoniobacteraceae bacterium]
MLPRVYGVRRIERETVDVFSLHVAPEDGEPLPLFAPGQFNMLYAFGIGEVPISIAGSGRDTIVHTVRAVGAVTRAMAGWKRGTTLGLRGPFGSAWPLEEAQGKDVLLIAGGIGLAPLWAALGYVLAHRARYRRIALLYGTRTAGDLLYKRELDRLADRQDLHLGITVDRAGMEWCGHVGVVPTLIHFTPFDPGNTIAMLCGPEVMMRFTVRELQNWRVPEVNIYVSLERNMKCAIGLCGHCQLGPEFICKDGPVFRYDRVARWLSIPEL